MYSLFKLAVAVFAVSVATTSWGGSPHVTYQAVNLLQAPDGSSMSGDLLVVHYDGSADMVPFYADSTGLFTSAESELYPYSFVPMTPTYIGGGGGGGGPIVDPNLNDGGDAEGRNPLVIGATCAAMIGLTRGFCSFDCRGSGVASWEAGWCGTGATCRCNIPPLPPRDQAPPRNRSPALVVGNSHIQQYIWNVWWMRP